MILLLSLGCAAETGGARVSFTAVASSSVTPEEVDGVPAFVYTDAASGWTVTLTRAEVAVGPLYLWSGKPTLTGMRQVPGIATAWAGADEFLAGYLRGEVRSQVAFDALSGEEVTIGGGAGTAGESLTAELWLEPPTGDIATLLGDATLQVAGTAEREGTVVPFAGSLLIDDTVVDPESGQTASLVRRVRGIPLGGDLADGGVLRVGIDPTRWLAGADFADLVASPPDADGAYPIAWPDPVWSVLFYQARQSGESGPWSLSFDPLE